jgi:hypothetical protein
MPAALIGRANELGLIEAFLEWAGFGRSTILVYGEPRIGKKILWEVAVARARERGDCVLVSRGVEPEAKLSGRLRPARPPSGRSAQGETRPR